MDNDNTERFAGRQRMRRRIGLLIVSAGTLIFGVTAILAYWVFYPPYAGLAMLCPTHICEGLSPAFLFLWLGMPLGASLIVIGSLLLRNHK